VEALLRAYNDAGSFLESGFAGTAATLGNPITERAVTVIGLYKLLEQIGEGGMGTVFVAEQSHPVQRKVALKIIKPGMDSRQVIGRFEAERQALALMDHPNIAKVFDVGTTEKDRPYFVMELVKGVPITKYCDEHRLTPRQRLELFLPVCQAVQHAHQKGIIHRDLKPSNVLVAEYDDKPVPKIIDFGVAKATGPKLTERTMHTEFGQVVGTLEYMSPEQAKLNALDIDTRSDIYTLGVLLYELLTGTTPFEKKRLHTAAFDEMLRIIREEEPPKPSTRLSDLSRPDEPSRTESAAQLAAHTLSLASVAANRSLEPKKLNGLVRGELDWIVMKCLEKDRNRRYETANGLAHDIENYLHDEPVLAGPPSAGYRLRKFVRRNKGPVLAAGLIVLALVGGVIGTTVGLFRANNASRAEAEQRHIAEKNEMTAREREAEIQAVLDFVENKVFAAAQPKDQEGGLGYDVKLVDAMKAVLPLVEKSFKDQPLIEARLRMTLGSSFWTLGEAKIADDQFQLARAVRTKQLGSDHPDTLSSSYMLALSCFDLGRNADALKLLEETLAFRKAKLGPDHQATLKTMNVLASVYSKLDRHEAALKLREETLVLQKAKLGPGHRDTLATMNNMGLAYAALGRHDDAVKLLEATLKLMKANIPEHRFTFNCMDSLALSYQALGRHNEAVKLCEEALTFRKARLGPDHRDTLGNMVNLAQIYDALRRLDDALNLREEVLALRKAKLGPDHLDTLAIMNDVGLAYANLDRHDDAVKLLEATLTLMKANIPDHRFTFNCMANLALSYHALGRHNEAVKLREEALAVRKARFGPDHPDTLRDMDYLAFSYDKVGRPDDALKLREEVLALRKAKLGLNHLAKAKLGPEQDNTLARMNNLANSYDALGRHDDALKLREEVLAIRKANLGPEHPKTLSSMYNLGLSYERFGRSLEALKLKEETLALQKATLGPAHPETLRTMSSVATGYAHLGRYPDAMKLKKETLALQKVKLGPEHPDTLWSMKSLASIYRALHRYPDDLKLREEVLALEKAKLGPDDPSTLISMANLAATYERLGQYAEAVKLLEQAKAKLGPGRRETLVCTICLAISYVRLGRFTEAAEISRQGRDIWEKQSDGWVLYHAACFRAVSAGPLRAADKSSAGVKQADAEADCAMALLTKAVAAGGVQVWELKEDEDFNALRGRDDFKKLLADLEAKAKGMKKQEERTSEDREQRTENRGQ
jgi:serine/threonine protein kinase/tetratricopeptide (TPR) repeat protein